MTGRSERRGVEGYPLDSRQCLSAGPASGAQRVGVPSGGRLMLMLTNGEPVLKPGRRFLLPITSFIGPMRRRLVYGASTATHALEAHAAESPMGKRSVEKRPPRMRPCEKGSSAASEPRNADAGRRTNRGALPTFRSTPITRRLCGPAALVDPAGREGDRVSKAER